MHQEFFISTHFAEPASIKNKTHFGSCGGSSCRLFSGIVGLLLIRNRNDGQAFCLWSQRSLPKGNFGARILPVSLMNTNNFITCKNPRGPDKNYVAREICEATISLFLFSPDAEMSLMCTSPKRVMPSWQWLTTTVLPWPSRNWTDPSSMVKRSRSTMLTPMIEENAVEVAVEATEAVALDAVIIQTLFIN